jgi:organic radical activating enzyme
MHTTLLRAVTPSVAEGHRDVAFCNTACQRCDDEMSVRAARYERAEKLALRHLMESAPSCR